MFRNPRENKDLPVEAQVAHSTGRAPSPPPILDWRDPANRRPPPPPKPAAPPPMATKSKPSPVRSASAGRVAPKKTGPASGIKPLAKPNTLITSFFKKTDSQDEGLFWGVNSQIDDGTSIIPEIEQWQDALPDEEDRFHETEMPVKRRKTSNGNAIDDETSGKLMEVAVAAAHIHNSSGHTTLVTPANQPERATERATRSSHGPFLEDSDSEGEESTESNVQAISESTHTPLSDKSQELILIKTEEIIEDVELPTERPPLLRQATSGFVGLQDFDEFNGVPDDDEDDGDEDDREENTYRKLAIEQRKLEMSDGVYDGPLDDIDAEALEDAIKEEDDDDSAPMQVMGDPEDATCPICTLSLMGVSASDAAVHVNDCLDGKPSPLPIRTIKQEGGPSETKPVLKMPRKYNPKPAKPGQENPFSLAPPSNAPKGKGSAFSKLMSNHAEDLAWKTAADAEQASRGKPAYTRTCPFYKIMPGFSICVDAFRYGAVEGCKAYFLSHFHSDHYIGLTAKWSHGPIYCSKVTANLVKQQLGVDPKYVVDLPWEEEREVPGTNGVKVTMISANHCPGSSLYLFEKVIGQGATPKIQRVLHCGDFRACKAHVKHPLLKPEVLDAVSGKTRQQKIDVCYLDTTYLNPKYAFPSQADVIQACSDMCVSLSKEFKNEADDFEAMKKERAGEGMVKFIADGTSKVKQEEIEPLEDRPLVGGARGRLLVVVGTYSIGKERICLGIAKALNSKIYAPPHKWRIIKALEDPEIDALMTKDPREAQVHMTPLFEIRAETLDDYLKEFRDTFTRAVGFRPSGWNYRPPNSRFIESPSVSTVLYGSNWKSTYSMRDLMPQRGSTRRAACYGVPYSEHSSFRELTMFCCSLQIDKVIPTVNVGSARSRERMRAWVDRWAVERKKVGMFPADDFGGIDTYAEP